ncbi:hypothetical protein D3C80_2098810 [compost metagenome]
MSAQGGLIFHQLLIGRGLLLTQAAQIRIEVVCTLCQQAATLGIFFQAIRQLGRQTILTTQ